MVSGGNKTYTCKRCGKRFIGWASAFRSYCGKECSNAEADKRAKKHGESQSRLHVIWCNMKTRCTCPTSVIYPYYGGRGIRVCDEWIVNYEAFRDWATANGYRDVLELDRIDVNGHYEPANCRWATRLQQMANTRKRRDGRTSVFKGVSWCANAKRWRAQINRDGRNTHVGVYRSELKAALAYDDAAFALRGEFARLNFPERKRKLLNKEVSHFSSFQAVG